MDRLREGGGEGAEATREKGDTAWGGMLRPGGEEAAPSFDAPSSDRPTHAGCWDRMTSAPKRTQSSERAGGLPWEELSEECVRRNSRRADALDG